MPDVAPSPENSSRDASLRNQKPPGILPKNAQTWVIAGLSVVMIAAIAISGNSGSKPKSSTVQPRQATVIDPNATRINEYRNRLEEETRRLEAEQAQLNQAKHALAVDQRATAAATPTPGTAYVAQQTSTDDRLSVQRQLEAEKVRKEYASLFASNVALSYRKDNTDHNATTMRATAVAPPPILTPYPYIYSVSPTATTPSAGANQGAAPGGQTQDQPPARAPMAVQQIAPAEPQTPAPSRHEKPNPELTRADGKNYLLLEGTVLETVLTNRLAGSFSGPG
jgi:type IV secretion system protein VirB10